MFSKCEQSPESSDHYKFKQIAINCTGSVIGAPLDGRPDEAGVSLPEPVRLLINNSLSENTKRAYAADLRHYKLWGGTIPASAQQVAEYLATLAHGYKAATLGRRLASLSKAHRAVGADDPCRTEIVKATMRGIRRKNGTVQRQARPILREDLFQMLEPIESGLRDRRDKALLLIGFAGAFRRSELVELNVSDIEYVRQGIVVTIRRSKTDQSGIGRKIGVPFGRTRWCPVKHLNEWLEDAGIEGGPLFRSINRHGGIADERLSGEAVSIVVKERVAAAGFDPDAYSGHSLRAGLATSAVIAGVSTLSIRRITGHASDAMLARYVRIGDLFVDNAVAYVL